MTPRFEWSEPGTLEAAFSALAVEHAVVKAGGVDLVDRLKESLDAPARVVNLRRVAGLDEIREAADGALVLGPLVPLARVAEHPGIRARWPAIALAAGQIATPNVRNVATIAGNLLQRPRCWYFRKEAFRCARKGGDTCFAQEGRNAYHAVLGNDLCAVIHPSDLAVPLVAHGAAVELATRDRRRAVSLESLYVRPEEDVHREHRLESGELVVGIRVPPPRGRAHYVKVKERESADWPLASAAAVLAVEGGRCTAAALVLGAAAPVPWRARAAEAVLVGSSVDAASADRAARAAVADARPLAENAHKVHLLGVTLRRAILGAGEVT
jgi:xanthine dehydrogenase YagS FAD-binding subunit